MAINGSTLKAFRESKNLSQSAFAKQLGIHPSSLSNIEAGRTTPSASTLRSYHKAGFRQPVGRPPSNGAAKETIVLKTDADFLTEAVAMLTHMPRDMYLYVLEALRAFQNGDLGETAPLVARVEDVRRKALLLEDLIRASDAGLIARLNRLEAMMTAAMEDPSQEPELQNTDRGPDDPRE